MNDIVPKIPQYNERAWAIDVISEITMYCSPRSRAVVRAGGEYTIAGQSGNLFPDVLLFGDRGGSIVQQGWELKMPDTPITNIALLDNAEQKARRLGLNSFIVWNVDEAALYVKSQSDNFEHCKSWPRTNISRREDVNNNRATWVTSLQKIIDDVNDFLDDGTVNGAKPNVAIGDSLFLDYLNQFTPIQSEVIESACVSNATFAAEVDLWWIINAIEHPDCSKFQGLARVNLVNWINRFIFAHYLKKFHAASRAVEKIKGSSSIRQAISIFDNISSSCDFMNVFSPAPGHEYLDNQTWSALVSLNEFLADFRLDTISQESFWQVLEGALTYSRKKLAGQFATPKALAEFLVRISIEDRTKPIIDPCCGTGTIVRAVYDLKCNLGISIPDALESTWGSDKFAFPLQLCSIALSDPLGMGEVIQVFQKDAFELNPGTVIKFTDPNGKGEVARAIPQMHAIVSNLPFVRFENKTILNPLISRVTEEVKVELDDESCLDNRIDLYAGLILHLRHMIEHSGRLGVIVSNSWLGTDWGKQFRRVLSRYFKIQRIVISSAGRWFSSSDVVTTIIVLEKREEPSPPPVSEEIEFITTRERIEEWDSNTEELANSILVSGTSSQRFTRYGYTRSRIEQLEHAGFGWSALFVDLGWVSYIEKYLVPVSQFFDIRRGERRGWDALFYPDASHNIEAEYIKPVLLSPRNIDNLVTSADREAFCCSDDIDTLRKHNKVGALGWIRRFETATNGVGRPLPQVLARSGHYWYEMKPTTLADFVLPMNPDKRLCVHRLTQRSFVNQRLIRLTSKPSQKFDVNLCHALMNSVIGMFQIEAAGFGRGLGVLDLNATKMAANFHMLDINTITSVARDSILKTFNPLLNRSVFELPQELDSLDRQKFDRTVLSAFGAEHLINDIYNSLLMLFEIRQTARS